jgi:hypothetical protein
MISNRLNDNDDQHQDQRAERLADPKNDHFGVMHGNEDGYHWRGCSAPEKNSAQRTSTKSQRV